MHSAHINIGSNIGDRLLNIRAAVAAIKQRLDPHPMISTPVESPPWGFKSSNTFINIGVTITTTLSPAQLLDTLLDIQAKISRAPHRTITGEYADRIIDIDLIAVDQTVVNTPQLTLPHPRMHLREFVLRPLAELNPQWRHPILHLTVKQLLDKLSDK